MPISQSSFLRRSGQQGSVQRARLRGCSRPRTDPPGCAATPRTQGTAVPLVRVEHHDDGTSQYTFGVQAREPAEVAPFAHESDVDELEHHGSVREPPCEPPDSSGAPELPLSTASSKDHILERHETATDHVVGGSALRTDPIAGATSGEGPLAGIPPPRRAYTMLTAKEMTEQLDSAKLQSEPAQMHTGVPDDSALGSHSHSIKQPASSSGTLDTAKAAAASQRKSKPSGVFQRVSHLGQMFCTALAERNLVSAVAVAHAVEEHGTDADCKVLAGPRFFRTATELRDTSAILSYLHALPPVALTTFTYQHAITACRALDDVSATLSVLELMYDRGTPPDAHHCSNALAVCKDGGEVEQGFAWFSRMTAAGTTPDAHMLAALAAACSARIRSLRAELKQAQDCDANAALQGWRRQQLVLADRAVGLLNLLPQTGRMSDTPLWNAIIECVAFSGQLKRALQLLDDMLAAGCRPDSRTFVALLTACNTEGEKAMAQKVYRVALQSRCGSLRVHTAALGICQVHTGSATERSQNLALAREIHRDVLNGGMRQDSVYKNKLIAAAGCSGDLEFAWEILAELRRLPSFKVSAVTAAAVIQACIACGQPAQAFTMFKQFIAEGVVPSVKSANQIMDAFAATGNMRAAVSVLEAAVAAGVVPQAGTIAALIGGCQRINSFELAFQVAQVAVARGIAMDGVIGYLLLKTCYTSIRMLWARTHAQIAEQRANSTDSEISSTEHNRTSADVGADADAGTSSSRPSSSWSSARAAGGDRVTPAGEQASAASHPWSAAAAAGSQDRQEWASCMFHALTGRSNVAVCEEGARSARDWRDRAHLVYRDLITNNVPITPRILERAIACMMLDVSRREKARTPQPQAAAPGLPTPPPPDPSCTVIARLDGRFDPRAYKYIDDGAAAGRLPSTAVAQGGRSVDLRVMLPATAEAYVLQLFHTLFRHLRGERGTSALGGSVGGAAMRASGSLALIVPPFRDGLVNTPSSQPERQAPVSHVDEQSHALSDDDLDDAISSPFQSTDRAPQASRIRRLQRQHAVDLSAVTLGHSNGTSAIAGRGAVRGELVGLAVASALRSLKVPHIVECGSGVLVCDAEDLSAWAHRRHIELLTRLQQRRRRGNELVHSFTSNSSDSEIDMDQHMHHGVHTRVPRRDLSDDLDNGSLTPGLSKRTPRTVGEGLHSHTSTLRASTLQAHHMIQPGPLPDSTACVWDKPSEPAASQHAAPGMTHSDPRRRDPPMHLGHIPDQRGAAEFDYAGVPSGDDGVAHQAHDIDEPMAGSSSE